MAKDFYVLSGFSGFLPQCFEANKNTKVSVGVSESAEGCASMLPCMEPGVFFKVSPCIRSITAGRGSSRPSWPWAQAEEGKWLTE